MDITGTWVLEVWRRYAEDGTVSTPFGPRPRGLLLYAPDGYMAVQMVVADRPRIAANDSLSGSEADRAQAYSTCLAYFGRYELRGDSVIHRLEGSLFPNWTDTEQVRALLHDGRRLVLQVKDESGRVTNEIVWQRPDP